MILTLINFINDINENKNVSIENLISERLDKTLYNYLDEIKRSFNSILNKRNRNVVIKELSKNDRL